MVASDISQKGGLAFSTHWVLCPQSSIISQECSIGPFFPNSSKPFYVFNPFYLDWWFPIMFLFCSSVHCGTVKTLRLKFMNRRIEIGWSCGQEVLHLALYGRCPLWWSSRVRGGSTLSMTIVGHHCGDKGWSSGTTSSSPCLSWPHWRIWTPTVTWNSRKGTCQHLGI